MRACPKTFASPPPLSCFPYTWVGYTFHDAKLPNDNRLPSGPRPKNAQTYAGIREINTPEAKPRAREERRLRREPHERQNEYEEAILQKYLHVLTKFVTRAGAMGIRFPPYIRGRYRHIRKLRVAL